jgi:hypothetical protein
MEQTPVESGRLSGSQISLAAEQFFGRNIRFLGKIVTQCVRPPYRLQKRRPCGISMETLQPQTIEQEELLSIARVAPRFSCILCKKPTTFRYDSIPICPRCAEENNL